MQNIRERLGKRLPSMPLDWLKIVAAVLLVLVSAGKILLENGMLHLSTYTQEGLVEAMTGNDTLTAWVGVASILRLLKGMALPLFACALVEGFLHTASFKNYLGRVALIALVGELAYDWAMTGAVLEFSQQNPALGVALCLVMLFCMSKLDRFQKTEQVICSLLIMLCTAFWMLLLRIDSGWELMLLTSIFYLFRKQETLRMLLGIVVSLVQPLGPFAFVLIFFYNGKLRWKRLQSVFYLLYPLHYLVLGLVAQWKF